MDDEIIDAAARAMSFLGEAALRASAADLVTRARSVALAAAGAGADADHIEAAAAVLEQAESAGRTQAVSVLLGAATTLEAALGVGLGDLVDAAADLERQCGEHRAGVAAMEMVRRAAEEQRAAPPPWWWWLLLRWRRRGRRVTDVEQGLLLAGSTPTPLQAPSIIDAARTAIDFLREAASSDHLVELAGEIVLSAHDLAVPHQSLGAARDALQLAASPSSANTALNELEAAATGVKGAARGQLMALRNPAAQLAAACQEYLEGSKAMAAVQRAAGERARQREKAVVRVQSVPPLPPPAPDQGDDKRFGCLGYLVATNGNPPKNLVASGAICSSYALSWMEICYAELAARVAIYGIYFFSIYFFYWILDVEDIFSRSCCLWFATALHLFVFGLACFRRDR